MAQFGSLEMVDPVSGGDGIPAGETKINLDTLEGYFNQEGFFKKKEKMGILLGFNRSLQN